MKAFFRLIALAAAGAATAHANAVVDDPVASPVLSQSFHDQINGVPAALDILSASVSFDSSSDTFLLRATTAGPVKGFANAGYVFGFETGGGTNTPFAGLKEDGISFDTAIVLKADATTVAKGITETIHGNEIFATVDGSLVPSKGLDPSNFTWALWSIDASLPASDLGRIGDFAPDANVAVAAVPEPQTYALMLAGLGVTAFVSRRRNKSRSKG